MAPETRFSRKAIAASVLLALGTGLAAPAAAQDDDRLRKLEAEVRALQRAVFPGGDGRYFEPEISTRPEQPTEQVGMPAESALSDVLARLSAIEAQLAQLTAANEVNAHALEQLERRMDGAEPSTPSVSTGLLPVPPIGSGPGSNPARGSGSGSAELAPVQPRPPAQADERGGSRSGPSPERVAAVEAIFKPATGDAGEDEYTYGFRLWEAGFYPEAQQQLALFLDKYPDHPRATFGRNLLGRAFLDAGDPRSAATYFLQNYQADKNAARAPDSLLFLAESMIALNDTNRACIALAEFGDSYPALATGRLKSQYDADRGKVDCN